ncbi:hypothetical protein K9N68_03700 [Kovacikia minuta CCNUW1]|uniref:hypothetical protein n=1 Tax=Kovacikia minuta TaxID=2931930 RepID=UPI001CCD8D7A|nr:hypothetical protein [Kovacikia minuta]UBF27087.1 hypothetical protein K9N68_03700 [Kovacikia minuta CCNUW1]
MTPELLNLSPSPTLSAEDLLVGSQLVHPVQIPAAILTPGDRVPSDATPGVVEIRPLSLATMTLISRAARDDAGLVPVLMIKEALVNPTLSIDQIRQMHVGLVHYLVSQINLLSGLDATGEALKAAAASPLGQTHLLLAKHFGWTPEQVENLTPGQVAVYLAGIEQLIAWDQGRTEV